MKILKLILKNMSAVEHAMKANEVEIDFTSAKNKICLLIGPNGSGKTTILSMLQPFSELGNLDVRNGNKMILEDKEGYKEIHIQKNDDIFIIKHFYTPHKGKSHSVKSYIMKNGVELNVNGNVSSFKEYVKEELQIETDYLKLVRLGSNVTSLIDLSATERKNFMSKILDDIGVYLDCYKSVNLKLRQLDEMISHTVDKINRLGIIDKEEFKRTIDKLQKDIDNKQNEYIEANSKLALLNNTISEIDDKENLKENLSKVTKKYNKMTSILEKKNQIESFDVSFYDKKIKETDKKLSSSTNEFEANDLLIQNYLHHLNTMQEQLRSYKIQMTKENESDKEIERMEENLSSIRLKLREYEDIIGDYKPSFDKKDFDDFVVFLRNTQPILRRTYEFGKPPVERTVNLLKSKKNVVNYINSHLLDLDDQKGDSSSLFISTIASRFMLGKEDITIDCKETCQAKTLFSQIQNLIKNSNVDDKNEDASFYHDMEYVYSNIMGVLPNFANYKEIIESLPNDMKDDFKTDTIYDKIIAMDNIYDEKKINQLLSLNTEYDNYIKLKEKYLEDENTMKKFSGMSNSKYVKEQIESIDTVIADTREKILNLKERNIIIKEDIDECNKSMEVYLEIKETIESYDEIKELFEKYTKDYKMYNETMESISNTKINTTRIKLEIDSLTVDLQKKISDIDQYKTLNKELEKMNSIYDEMTYTKSALSSKEGMPLRHIKKYLNNTEEITNELLDIAYDGNIYIDKFDISPNEFSIPFYNKGIRLDDVKFASQGELSFLSIALSFALSSQKLSKYNIMLLDEIDGPLDTVNREKFIRIVENQIDRIQSEQNFCITHNTMFSSYPVDIIDLSMTNDSDAYPLANFIKITRVA